MITRKQVENILKINGLSSTASDDQVRRVLLGARFTKEEAETALMVLRQSVSENQTRIDGLHKVFRTDRQLKPAEISALLGIDIAVEQPLTKQKRIHKISAVQFIIIWFFSVVVAVSGILFYMYLNEVGLFHPSVAFSFEG